MTILSSMTGFARIDGRLEAFTWCWELKSVNGRSLDLRFRMPSGFETIEQQLKIRAGETLRRGTISATLTTAEPSRPPTLKINEAVLNQAIRLLDTIRTQVAGDPPRLDGLLALPGVMEIEKPIADSEAQSNRVIEVERSFGAALAALSASREAEGQRIALMLADRLDEIDRLIRAAADTASLQPAAMRRRFATQLDKLLDGTAPVGDERLAQEVALLIQRADVREELDRLAAHIIAARDLLAEGAGVGRKLDFLCQEFNREANTICSKSADLGLTRIGLDLKATIEQFREQVQNVE